MYFIRLVLANSFADVPSAIRFLWNLQEFSVQTNGVSARYGLHPGSVINAITKSGTNQIHGDIVRVRSQWRY